MSTHRKTVGLLTSLAVAAAVAAGTPAQATAAPGDQRAADGERSLAQVLAADGNVFDENGRDFDIAERAVLKVLKKRPGSPLVRLTQGYKPTTVFLPQDRAFRRLVADLTDGKKPGSEKATFKAVASLGLDTIESVLRYHVITGQTLVSEDVVAAKGERLRTSLNREVKVTVNRKGVIRLQDLDENDANPVVLPNLLDINRGNRQVAHGIDRVLRPADL